MVRKLAVILLTCLMLTACEKSLNLQVPDYDKQVVVEGRIIPGEKAGVVLTYTTPFFSVFDSASLLEYRLTNAKMIISNDTVEEVMILQRKTDQYPPYAYESKLIKGKVGEQYTIAIYVSGETYQGTTMIPEPVSIDSLWSVPVDSLAYKLNIRFADPPPSGNFYQIRMKVQGQDQQFVRARTSVYSDEFFNGERLSISAERGLQNILETGEQKYFQRGDKVIVEFSAISKETYDFWSSYEDLIRNSGNPFSSSNQVLKSNVGNAIGIWAGYGVSYDTVLIQ